MNQVETEHDPGIGYTVEELIAKARLSIRESYIPEPGREGRTFDKEIDDVRGAVSALARALEKTRDSEPEAEGVFKISFPSMNLSVSEIWPEGDAPEHPTAEDVIDRMKDEGTPGRIAADWLLVDGLYVNGIQWEVGI